jgi:WD40 repeat protein/serine/threonine protein kinase
MLDGVPDGGAASLVEGPGTSVGRYRLMEQIGEGGFGVVFMAEQQQPVSRKVALKVIKPGMDTKQVVARFEAERQALALMEHLHIARVLDAGATDAGRPYFVMELVRGIPITEFCDRNGLTPKERLELFVTVCQAVQHAHQKGIIHRDLKPSNVLVTLQDDGTPLVKVIDFGIAKALGQERLTEKTLCTGFAQMLGTPLYMSPEQAEMSGQDVDTRTDVHALGVLLYELLTGTTPFDKERLKEASYDEIRRIIREEEPARPSTRISTLGKAATTMSANRKSEPRRLSQLFRGELDWIVMKALEKDRNRRYESASAFVADVQRYLHDEPVQACPPSTMYRFRKFARRNRGTLLTATAVAIVVLLAVVGLATSTILIAREQQATATALRAETQAKDDLEQVLERERELRDEERQNSYFQRIALAEREWSANNLGLMEQLLDTCPADLRGWEWRYLKRLPLGGLPPIRHGTGVLSVAFSPDDRRIVVGDHSGFVTIWNAMGEKKYTFRAHQRHISGATFSPDGRLLATGSSWENKVKVWDFDRLQADPAKALLIAEIAHPEKPDETVDSVAFSPDGRRLASAVSGTVYVWDVATGGQVFAPVSGPHFIRQLTYSPDGNYLASADADIEARTVRIWNARTGREERTLAGHKAAVQSVSFSPDGRWLASATGNLITHADSEIKLWDVRTWKNVRTFRGHTGVIWSVVFSPDGQGLASAGTDEAVKLWDLRSGQEVLTLRGHYGGIRSVNFSHDGTRLVSAGGHGTILIWDATPLGRETGQESLTLSHGGPVRSLAFSPDGQWLASVTGDGTVRLWDDKLRRAGGGNAPLRTLVGYAGITMKVLFSPRGRFLVSGGKNRLKAWDTTTWTEHPIPSSGGAPFASSSDGKYLATCKQFGEVPFVIEIRNATTGQGVCSPLRDHDWAISEMAISPHADGPRLASGSVDGTVRVWDVKTGKQIVQPPLCHGNDVQSVAFSQDGRFLASGGRDHVVKVWSTQTWKLFGELPDLTAAVICVAFHPRDSSVLAWGGSDSTVRVWKVGTKEIHALRGHRSWVESVAFSPDGEWLASASLDGTVKIWKTPPLAEATEVANQ